MVAIGVGGADAVDVMTGYPFNVRWPKLIGVHLTGSLNGWSSPKDVILKVADILTVKGGTGAIVEYFRRGRQLHLGHRQGHDLQHGRRDRGNDVPVRLRRRHRALPEEHRPRGRSPMRPTPSPTTCVQTTTCSPTPEAHFDQVITIDPRHPHTPHQRAGHTGSRPTRWRPGRRGQGQRLAAGAVGGSGRLLHQLLLRGHHRERLRSCVRPPPSGLKVKTPLLITLGSEQVRATIERDGLLEVFEAAGATVLANACGPCIGQWSRPESVTSELNTIVTSYNRNFPKRNDGSANTLAFVTSPETVVALALRRDRRLRPLSDTLTNDAGEEIRLAEPVGEELPALGFTPGESGFIAPRPDGSDVEVIVSPTSDRLQLLTPFEALGRRRLHRPARTAQGTGKVHHGSHLDGRPRLKYCGTFENISGTCSLGAVNAFTGVPGEGKGPTRRQDQAVPRDRGPLPRGRSTRGSLSATRTGARVPAANTLPWNPASGAPRRSSCAASPGSTRPTSRSRACSP